MSISAAMVKDLRQRTGGVEQNGPYLAGGKHNYVLQTVLPYIARAIGEGGRGVFEMVCDFADLDEEFADLLSRQEVVVPRGSWVLVQHDHDRAVNRAIDAGVRCIEHNFLVSEDTIKRMKKDGVALSIQSVMKLGCRSQSWYIMSQKQYMIRSQAISRT